MEFETDSGNIHILLLSPASTQCNSVPVYSRESCRTEVLPKVVYDLILSPYLSRQGEKDPNIKFPDILPQMGCVYQQCYQSFFWKHFITPLSS